eukprot:TRINITY_DN6412_c0_g1_i1.p1 TRINITY_DN6412_c0_g1~~TRINITY_DN6412_c0_g1_i1.p1  ORF type:complete len:152 (-),score=6.91 TRINITY_DN6412_c0_g1_i1:136-591(-)
MGFDTSIPTAGWEYKRSMFDFPKIIFKNSKFVFIWLLLLGTVIFAVYPIMIFDYSIPLLICAIVNPLSMLSLMIAFMYMGMVKFLGMFHVIYWIPLEIYLVLAFILEHIEINTLGGWYLIVLMAFITLSLILDIRDVYLFLFNDEKSALGE